METPYVAPTARPLPNAAPAAAYPEAEPLNATFAGWAAREVERLMAERDIAVSDHERAEIDLRLAMLCEAAQRFGRSLADVSEY